jgi:hypothetical protein
VKNIKLFENFDTNYLWPDAKFWLNKLEPEELCFLGLYSYMLEKDKKDSLFEIEYDGTNEAEPDEDGDGNFEMNFIFPVEVTNDESYPYLSCVINFSGGFSKYYAGTYNDPPEGGEYQLSDIDLASRLSFFLWSSIPDEELLKVAEQGKLRKPEVLDKQIKRMLADPRSTTLVNNFAEQWLLLRNLKQTEKNQELFPQFDESLRKDFQKETELFLGSIFQDDRSILDLFRADYKFLNERLAHHYGIPGIYGNRFRKVSVTDENKQGLLAQGAILAITSYPNRTSPVLRGKWVLQNIMAAPPPPPPTVIPALKESDDNGKVLSMRQAIEKHRANPVCQVCHNRMDPIGFGLENFNPIGQWRDEDAGSPVDSSGVLPDGSKFQGPSQLQKALLSKSTVIVSAFTQKLLTYAMGRDLAYYDMTAVRKIVHDSADSDYKFSIIVSGIVNSLPFQMRRTGS